MSSELDNIDKTKPLFDDDISDSAVMDDTLTENNLNISSNSDKTHNKNDKTEKQVKTIPENDESKKIVLSVDATSSSNTKIAPKPANITKLGNNAGQFVLIQSSGTNNSPLRISGASSSSNTVGSGFQYIKTSDGTILQIRTTNKLTNTSGQQKKLVQTVGSNSQIGKFILKGTGQQIILATPPTNKNLNIGSQSVSGAKTLSVSQAQQLGLLSSTKIKQIIPIGQTSKPNEMVKQPTKILPAPSSGGSLTKIRPTTAIQPKLLIQQAGKTIVTKTMPMSTGSKQIFVQPHLLKLPATQQQGQIQAVNIPGKGVQYVRVLNAPNRNQLPKIIAQNSQTKIVKSTGGGQQKLLLQGKSGKTFVISQNTSATNSESKSIITKNPLTKTPIQKKVQGNVVPTKLIAVVKNEEITLSKSETSDTNSKLSTLTTSQLNQLQGTVVIPGNNKTQIVMLPPDYMQQLQKNNQSASNTSVDQNFSPVRVKKEFSTSNESLNDSTDSKLYNSNDLMVMKRRPCNCTKSQCLKLYCDCFANGEFCSNCNCKECFNTLEYEDERQKAIKICLERNPNAFRPKIGKSNNQIDRRHNKGCNCKRSGCLKNYCECYEAKIACSSNCKCFGCRNVEDIFDRKGMQDLSPRSGMKRHHDIDDDGLSQQSKQPYNFMTADVVEATVQCMIAQADDCQKVGIGTKKTERMILEEFGRCLAEIIDFSIKNSEN